MITSLHQYIETIEQIIEAWGMNYRTTTHPWYRGHSNETYKLLPSIFRKGIDKEFEREMTRDFQLNSLSYLAKPPESYIEWLYVMQHFGLPTRLLDWSESYLFALYFAVEEYEQTKYNPCVWIFDPWTLNTNVLNLKSIPTHKSDFVIDYELSENHGKINRNVHSDDPIAIRAIRNNERIFAQKGLFTIHGNRSIPLEDFKPNPKRAKLQLEKIVIDKSYKKKIFRELFKAGITPSKIYPDLDGLCKEIKIKYQKSYTFE